MLFAIGFTHLSHSLESTIQHIELMSRCAMDNPYFKVTTENKHIDGSDTTIPANHRMCESIGELIDKVIEWNTKQFKKEIIMNNGQIATITKTDVKIGEDTITHENIKRLYDASVLAQQSEL